MKRKFLCLLLLTGILPFAFFSEGCSFSSTCDELIRSVDKCTTKWVGTYGKKFNKTCRPGAAQCETSQLCIQPPGSAFAKCHLPGPIHQRQQVLIERTRRLCGPIFTARQVPYIQCIKSAQCDVKKFNACNAKLVSQLKKEKEKGSSGFLIGLLIFLVVSALVEGLLIFGGIKILDKNNPRNTIVRAFIVGIVSGLITFPMVFFSPLTGVLISSSLLFSLIIVTYQLEVFMPAAFTAFHIFWAWSVFTFMVAGGTLGGKAWLSQGALFRQALNREHTKMEEVYDEFERNRKKLEAAKRRAKAEAKRKADEAAKEKAAKEKAAKEAADNKKKKKRRRRRRRR